MIWGKSTQKYKEATFIFSKLIVVFFGILACVVIGFFLANSLLPSESGRDFRAAATIAGVFIGLFAILMRAKYRWTVKTLIFSLTPIELILMFAIMSGSGSYVIDAFNLRWFAGLNLYIMLPWFIGMGIGSGFIKDKS